MLEKLLKLVFENLNVKRHLMYTVFDSISFISVAKELVCAVLKCQSSQSQEHSNTKMLHKCGYYISVMNFREFAQLSRYSATTVLNVQGFLHSQKSI